MQVIARSIAVIDEIQRLSYLEEENRNLNVMEKISEQLKIYSSQQADLIQSYPAIQISISEHVGRARSSAIFRRAQAEDVAILAGRKIDEAREKSSGFFSSGNLSDYFEFNRFNSTLAIANGDLLRRVYAAKFPGRDLEIDLMPFVSSDGKDANSMVEKNAAAYRKGEIAIGVVIDEDGILKAVTQSLPLVKLENAEEVHVILSENQKTDLNELKSICLSFA